MVYKQQEAYPPVLSIQLSPTFRQRLKSFRYCLINGLKNEVYTRLSDILVARLKERSIHMSTARFVS